MSAAATSSGLKLADVAIYAAPCRVTKLIVIADGTNAATAVLYDNASAASGTVLAKIIVDAGATQESLACDVVANNGVYLDVTGTGCEAIVHFIAS